MVCVSNFGSVGLSSHAICKSTCFSPALTTRRSDGNRPPFPLKHLFDIVCFVSDRLCCQGEFQSNSDVVIIQFPIGLSLICSTSLEIRNPIARVVSSDNQLSNASVVVAISNPSEILLRKMQYLDLKEDGSRVQNPSQEQPFRSNRCC